LLAPGLSFNKSSLKNLKCTHSRPPESPESLSFVCFLNLCAFIHVFPLPGIQTFLLLLEIQLMHHFYFKTLLIVLLLRQGIHPSFELSSMLIYASIVELVTLCSNYWFKCLPLIRENELLAYTLPDFLSLDIAGSTYK